MHSCKRAMFYLFFISQVFLTCLQFSILLHFDREIELCVNGDIFHRSLQTCGAPLNADSVQLPHLLYFISRKPDI